MPQKMTANEVAEQLSVSVTTVKTWADRLGIGDKASSGKRLFEERDLEALRVAKSLRAEDCGFDTITRRLVTVSDSQQLSPTFTDFQQQSPEPQSLDIKALAAEVAATLSATVTAAIRTDNELAEKYARSAHRIGELEAEVRHLTEDRTRLLTSGQDQAGEVERLRTELATERTKPWWRRIMGLAVTAVILFPTMPVSADPLPAQSRQRASRSVIEVKAQGIEYIQYGEDGSFMTVLQFFRFKIPGGWLLRSPDNQGGAPTFVPDPEHKWDGKVMQ